MDDPIPNSLTEKREEKEEEEEEEEEEESDDFNYVPQMDRGWSWVVMMASFCCNLLTDGITFCSGLVLSELVVTFNESVSKTAWVSSLQSGISMLAGETNQIAS